ncbi:hypothetical protein GCM10007937_18150 [Mesorhizobium albiziae]|nr:hypothetical protein GCM10007937_18150 [Mesorhizobium albiziae]
MIVRPRPSFWKLFFVMRGSVVPRILPQIFGFALYGAAVVAVVKVLKLDLGNAGVAPFALLGVALSVYMGFRNNAAYDRWWEARKLWGQLVFEIRNLSRAASALISDRGELRPLLMDSLAFCHFLRGELRKVDARGEARAFVGNDVDAILAASNQPDALLRRMGQRIGALKRGGALEPRISASSTSGFPSSPPCRPVASASWARRCLLPTRCSCSAPPISSAFSCPSAWLFRPAGQHRCSRH